MTQPARMTHEPIHPRVVPVVLVCLSHSHALTLRFLRQLQVLLARHRLIPLLIHRVQLLQRILNRRLHRDAGLHGGAPLGGIVQIPLHHKHMESGTAI